MVKVVVLFLLAMVVIGMVGRLLGLGLGLGPGLGLGRRKPPLLGRFCPNCGRPHEGPGACTCRGRG